MFPQVETAYRCACVLRDTINPYLIRRMKADVKQNLNLPGKNEQVLFCRLTDEQKNVYQEYLESRECNAILQGKFQIFAGLIMLRKICNHSDLSTGGLQLFNQGPSDLLEDQFGHWSRSGKMIVVEALLRLWKKQDHRVLLFTQSKTMLCILEKFVQQQGYRYLTMDGGTSISARQPLIDQYNKDQSIFVFLLTTRVGGLGVNLTGADRVIIFDPDWNPSTDTQARERAWRIGQQRQVTIYRLLTSGTIEEKIYHRQIFKQFLTNRILKDPKQRRLFKSQDMYELFTLGSQDNQQGTETSALFAGTGSDVRVPKKARKNRFDEMEERRQKTVEEEEEEEERDPPEKAEDERGPVMDGRIDVNDGGKEVEKECGFDNAEIERMKELAKMLSRKMEMEKQKKNDVSTSLRTPSIDTKNLGKEDQDSPSKSAAGAEQQPSSDVCKEEDFSGSCDISFIPDITVKTEFQIKKEKSDGEASSDGIDESEIGSSIPTEPGPAEERTNSKTNSSLKHPKWEKNGTKWTIPSLRMDRSLHKEAENYASEVTLQQRERNKHKASSIEKSEHRLKGREESKHKKRRKRDARFEGERIPNLVKHCPLAKAEDSAEDSRKGTSHVQDKHSEAEQNGHDDYVLRELFKKTGIQGAMKHDKIMESGRPDYAIVEAEAEKVAREAVAALRRSRQNCASALSGLPTWTGQHGSVAKPRFGQKKNSLLVGKSSKQDPPTTSQINASNQSKPGKQQEKKVEKLFDGSVSGNVSLSSKSDSLSSNDLLSRIKARKRISSLGTTAEDDDNDEEDEFLRPDRPAPQLTTIDSKDEDLLKDIRDYIAFMGAKDGEASSQEIVLNFGKRLPPAEAPKFKAMLQQICDLQAGGIWKLKAEFR
ncbi:DNA excision repair protein ERCC-6 [Elysia marginata]|uniref:DNA excision repair protein ERCC-6 n=1 Tax=Elysia marginata TaxID=1093978 RepID=A0AAV4GKN9_9GAST|nr:DNA excision repair protein ERCC-6 [Elysia marginata]